MAGGFSGFSFGAPAAAASGGFGAFGTSSAAAPAATGGFGAAAPAASTGGFGFGGASAAASSGGFGGGFGAVASSAASSGGFGGLGAFGVGAAAPAAGAGSSGGFGAFGAASSTAAASAAAPAFGAFGASKPNGGIGAFGAASSGGFGTATTGGVLGGLGSTSTGGFGVSSGAAGTAGNAAAVVVLPHQYQAGDFKHVVMPIEGMGNFMGDALLKAQEKDQPIISREASEVYQAANVQFFSWNPWDPAILASNGRAAAANAFRQPLGTGKTAEDMANMLRGTNPAEVERQLAALPQEQQDLVRMAMMPRFSAQTLAAVHGTAASVDVVENQWCPHEWKPEVDNAHCRFRHYVLQPLTQAQMRLPADQRHGLNQTAASSPNDPLFQSKLQENPNPYKYCVLPIVGFHQLLRRVRMQDDKLKEQNDVLQSFEEEVNRMKEFQAVEFPKMVAQRRAKQVELSRRALECIRRVEMQRSANDTVSSREVQVVQPCARPERVPRQAC
jgi:hypothetical protein